MINSAQEQLEAILALLEENRDIRPVTGRRFRGTNQDDVFFGRAGNANGNANGRSGNITANGRGGNDALFGLAGIDRFRGGRGNDLLDGADGDDVLSGEGGADDLNGSAGNDQLDGGNNADFVDGGVGTDTLTGGNGNDRIVGGDGVDRLTGGDGNDQFVYSGNLFANGTPALVAAPNIRVLNQPDVITDYAVGQDQFVFDREDLANIPIVFQKGISSQIGDGNVIILQDAFAAAGAAARAIANNPNVVANEGIFVYFNTTLGLNRVVHSKDLGDGGDISVLANLDNQRTTGLSDLARYSAADFAVV